MNYNANTRNLGPTRKTKRVSDVNAMGVPSPGPTFPSPGPPVYNPNAFAQQMPTPEPHYNGHVSPNYGFNPQMSNSEFVQYPVSVTPQYATGGPYGGPQLGMGPPQFGVPGGMPGTPGFNVFQQPMVQDMALQYGQQLAQTGKTFVNREIEKYVPVSRLKYYFAVDTKYVLGKLKLIFFPFTHKDWSVKYEQDAPVQPRYEINAPDLYIPTMAYVTYVLLAGLILGTQNRFSPEQIGIQASSALAYSLFEIAVYWGTLYVTNIQTTLKLLDLLAFSGYKYVTIIACLLVSLLFQKPGYYMAWVYCSLALAFFLVRTLKALVLVTPQPDPSQQHGGYGSPVGGYTGSNTEIGGTKRRLYFLLFVAISQPLLSWWLSFHLLPATSVVRTILDTSL